MTTLAPPAPEPPAESSDEKPRLYHVLEERTLLDVLRELLPGVPLMDSDIELLKGRLLYDHIDVIDSRNAEGAVRTAAKQAFGNRPAQDAAPTLIPVAERCWHPRVVRVRTTQTVRMNP